MNDEINENDGIDPFDLDFATYQEKAATTAIYPGAYRSTYPLLGLVGEVGEFANKYKKVLRDGREFPLDDVASELGDILWYLSALATDFGLGLDYIANKNLDKLFDRKERGVIGGSVTLASIETDLKPCSNGRHHDWIVLSRNKKGVYGVKCYDCDLTIRAKTFIVETEKGKGSYRKSYAFDSPAAAFKWFRGINTHSGYKKRLITDTGFVIARVIT